MPEPKVDFAIITALHVERDAIVRRLEGFEKIQFDDEPLTFYTGSGEHPRRGAAVHGRRHPAHRHGELPTPQSPPPGSSPLAPRNVLMVGIAGGVKGKAALGDVVVSQYAYYYEPAKLTEDGVEHRGRQFNSDLLLYARAQHYEAAEWKGEIHVARPDAGGEEAVLPTSNSARSPAARRSSPTTRSWTTSSGSARRWLRWRWKGRGCEGCPERTATRRATWKSAASATTPGRTRTTAGTSTPPTPPPRSPSASSAPARSRRDRRLNRCRAGQGHRHPGHDRPVPAPISAEEIMPALDEETKRGQLEFMHLDFTDLVQNKVFTDPQAAAAAWPTRRGAARRGRAPGRCPACLSWPRRDPAGRAGRPRRHRPSQRPPLRLPSRDRHWAGRARRTGFPRSTAAPSPSASSRRRARW